MEVRALFSNPIHPNHASESRHGLRKKELNQGNEPFFWVEKSLKETPGDAILAEWRNDDGQPGSSRPRVVTTESCELGYMPQKKETRNCPY